MNILTLIVIMFHYHSISFFEINGSPNNYTKGNDGNLYKYFSEELKWIDASKKCDEDGAHLAIDDSPIVHSHLINMYPSLQFWIGVNELASEGVWRYNDGRKVANSFWGRKQPDDIKKDDYCVVISESGRWYNEPCTLQKCFVCQIKEIPDGYKKGLDGNYYKMISVENNWHNANLRCHDDGAHLAVVDSDDVQKYLTSEYSSVKYWLGINDLTVKGKWMFADGRTIAKGYWESNIIPKEQGDCVIMGVLGRWQVDKCDKERYFMCQVTTRKDHLIELMSSKIKRNEFTAPAIMIAIVLVILLFIIWCIFKHRKRLKQSKKVARKSEVSNSNSNEPRFVINLKDTITINQHGNTPISTIHKSVVLARTSNTTIYNVNGYDNTAYSCPSSFYSMAE